MSTIHENRPGARRPVLRTMIRWSIRAILALIAIAVIAFVLVFRDALLNRFVRFPAEARAWQALQAQRIEVTLDDGYTDYQGVCHSHSHISHDSQVPFEEIQRV